MIRAGRALSVRLRCPGSDIHGGIDIAVMFRTARRALPPAVCQRQRVINFAAAAAALDSCDTSCSWQAGTEEQHKFTRELAACVALGIGDRAEIMDMVFAIGTANSRELESEHGAPSDCG